MSLEALGLHEDADEDAVRARYKELAKKAHPDMGGTAEEFQRLGELRDQALKEAKFGQTLANRRSALHALREAARGTKCPRCDGTGTKMTFQSGFRQGRLVCTMCRGTGKLQ